MTKIISALALLAVLAAASSSCSSQKSEKSYDSENLELIEDSLTVVNDTLTDSQQIMDDEIPSTVEHIDR